MPKTVDHETRRAELAAAVWRLIRRDGIEAASIRRVATEAGWSSGSLRHYFATQSELLTFAMELVVQRATARISAHTASWEDPRAAAAALLRELVPLDDERRAEMEVWLVFSLRAQVDPTLRPLRDQANDAIRQLCRELATALGADDPARTGDELHAFADGLALQGTLTPEAMPPERIEALLEARLAEMEPAPGERPPGPLLPRAKAP